MKTQTKMARLLALISILVLCKNIDGSSLKLKQVLVLSRHNVRTPLTSNLQRFSPKQWPKWDAEVADLTAKGARLEKNVAEYFSSWLEQEKLFDTCPERDEVLIFANTKPRTVNSAKVFAEFAFKNCNVTVKHKNTSAMDPIFNPIFHNTSKPFKNEVIKEMQAKLDAADLNEAYAELNRILDIQNSDICKEESLCDLTLVENRVVNQDGEEPNVSGPLFYGNSIVDSFIMSYYEGKPDNEIAWGEIKSPGQWELLSKISKENQNVRFNLTTGSKDLAQPLLHYMFEIFKKSNPKFTLLMGHDSNLNPVIKALGFKSFMLDQYEPFPIGGRLVFQKWNDGEDDFLKIEYFYQTFSQLRDGTELSLLNPPRKVTMELITCEIDENGFCPWNDFMKIAF